VGPIPEGHQIDHVKAQGCVYRDCVAIEHLEPVTQAENIRRIPRIQAQIARTECPQGHKYEGGNLRVRRGRRECRRCHNDRTAARKRERRNK
jgi:hypothetical protein